MMLHIRSDRWVGLFFLVLSLVVAVIWVPFDSETWLIDKVRRRYIIGDGLAPTVAAVLMALSALSLFLKPRSGEHHLDLDAGKALGVFIGAIVFSLLLMRLTGPSIMGAIDIITVQDWSYRPLRATFPFRYMGFLLGGTVMIAGLGWFMDGKISRRVIIRSLLITFAVAACFDLPFEDIILPPNGDM